MINFETFSNNITETENIISSKYHFKFVDLKEETTDRTDMMMNILQARVITEGICRFIVLQEHLVKDEKCIRTATLKVYVDDLLRPNLIVPKPIISNLSTIQAISNLAVHFQVEGHLDIKETNICIESLELVLNWFIKQYASCEIRQNQWKITSDMLNKSGAVPPKTEGCMISRKREVGEIRTEIVSNKKVILRGYTGIGKTELAKDYVKEFRRKYDGVYYAENIDDINSFFYDLPIGIVDEELKTKEEIIEEKLEVIHSMDLTYLFIIDNYTGLKDELYKLFPDKDDKYHLMVIVGEEYEFEDNQHYYEVGSFTPEESFQIFRFFCKTKFQDDEIMSLLSYLSYNPKAIKMSAVFLRDNDSYSPEGLINSLKRNYSIKSIMQNLYTVLTELAILEKDESVKVVAECLSLIPYNGVSKERFVTLLSNDLSEESQIEEILSTLEDAGWMNIDNMGFISMNPLLSDTIFEKTHPDMTSDTIVKFVSPILRPTREIRELFLSQVIALGPFVDHLAKRAESAGKCDLSVLNDIREYYISIFNLPKVDDITELMEKEFKRYTLNNVNIVEHTIYRQGISRFNLEDFSEAHIHFSRALEMLNQKKADVEKLVARISAYEGASLAALGDKEHAIEIAEKSIRIREKLGKEGDESERRALWISHYNYAKVLLELEMYNEALSEIEEATSLYMSFYPDEYKSWKSTNVSSLFQLKGRILSGLGKDFDAINLLEDAKNIREKLKGETYFSTAQVYSYLMEVYSKICDYKKALEYAHLYYNVLLRQHKTEDIKTKIKDVGDKMSLFEEKIKDA